MLYSSTIFSYYFVFYIIYLLFIKVRPRVYANTHKKRQLRLIVELPFLLKYTSINLFVREEIQEYVYHFIVIRIVLAQNDAIEILYILFNIRICIQCKVLRPFCLIEPQLKKSCTGGLFAIGRRTNIQHRIYSRVWEEISNNCYDCLIDERILSCCFWLVNQVQIVSILRKDKDIINKSHPIVYTILRTKSDGHLINLRNLVGRCLVYFLCGQEVHVTTPFLSFVDASAPLLPFWLRWGDCELNVFLPQYDTLLLPYSQNFVVSDFAPQNYYKNLIYASFLAKIVLILSFCTIISCIFGNSTMSKINCGFPLCK